MASVDIGDYNYDVFADVDFADEYLAGDILRGPIWLVLPADQKPVALVSATRLLLRQSWRDGPPSFDDPPLVVQQATAILAADMAAKPASVDSAGGGSNVKSVGAGSAKVEFFAPVSSTGDLPSSVLALLGDLLGSADDADAVPAGGTAYGSNDCQHSRFDRTDYGMIGDGIRPVDRSEYY